MKPEHLARYRAVLAKMAAKVDGLVTALEKEGLHPLGDDSSGESFPPDAASEEYEQAQTIAFIEEEEHLRDEILGALRRIRDGGFGACERCGQSISLERLNAVPFVRHCIDCAEALEADQ